MFVKFFCINVIQFPGQARNDVGVESNVRLLAG